jgi:hypothetical protein
VTGFVVVPLLLTAMVGAILLAGTRAPRDSPEYELRALVRADGIAGLMASLRQEPAFVVSSRCSPFRNRLVLDLGDVELDVHCYSPPRRPVDVVTAVYFQSSVGWVVETTGRGGSARLHGWLLDVRRRAGR